MKKSYSILIIPVFIALLLLNACSSPDNVRSDKYIIENNFEEISFWTETSSVIKSVSRSGSYATFCDETHPYSATLRLPYSVVKKLNTTRLTGTAWIKSDKRYPSSKLVLSIEDNGKNYYWNGSDSTALSDQTNEWREVKVEGIIPPGTPETATIIFYGWNTGKDFILWDDFKLTAN
jgi:hypothetical protein